MTHSTVDIKFGMFCFCQEMSTKPAQFHIENLNTTQKDVTNTKYHEYPGLQVTDRRPDFEIHRDVKSSSLCNTEVPLYERSSRNIHKYKCKHFRHELELKISAVVYKKHATSNMLQAKWSLKTGASHLFKPLALSLFHRLFFTFQLC